MRPADSQSAHFNSFVESFITPRKRERWKYLYLNSSRNLFHESHKFRADLSKSLIVPISESSLSSVVPKTSRGVFLDFRGDSKELILSDAVLLGAGQDAIFSIVPGQLALFFFHEDELWLCRK